MPIQLCESLQTDPGGGWPRSFAKRDQVPIRAHVNLVIHQRRRRDDAVAEVISRQDLKAIAWLEDDQRAAIGAGIDLAVADNGRRIARAATAEPWLRVTAILWATKFLPAIATTVRPCR